MIGALQWVVTLGCFDISTVVITLSSFRANPRVGHLDRVKRIYGYLSKMKHASLRFRTGLPDYSAIDVPEYGWEKSIYGDIEEAIPEDCPVPKGNPVVLTSYVDANLCHDMITQYQEDLMVTSRRVENPGSPSHRTRSKRSHSENEEVDERRPKRSRKITKRYLE